MKNLKQQLQDILIVERKRRKMTQVEFAKYLGINKGKYNKLENGTDLKLGDVPNICDKLGYKFLVTITKILPIEN